MKKFVVVFLFFVVAPINLGIGFLALTGNRPQKVVRPFLPTASQVYAALPQKTGQVLGSFQTADARPIIIQKYLEKYHSPLVPYAYFIVSVSDQYGIDWRLLVAIAQQESNLGKKIPPNSYNAWGWGIHSRGTLHFSSWQEGIKTVARGLKEKYIDKGYITPEEIMSKYTPSSNGSWVFGVNQFIQELEDGQIE